MPDNDRISIDSLTQAPELSSGDVTAVVHTVNGVKSTYKSTMTLLGTFLNKVLQYSSDLHTNSKTIIGAINEINDGGGGGSAVILYGTSAPTSQQGSDGNLYVQYTEGTGGASDVVDALYVKLDDEWCQISTGGGGGGTAASVSFDDTNVEFEADDVQEAFESIVKTLTWAQYQALSAAEKNNGTIYYISDRSTPISYNDVDDKPQVNGNTLSGNKSNSDLGIYGKTINMSSTDPDKVADRIEALETSVSGKASNTIDHIGTDEASILGRAMQVNDTFQIPSKILNHRIVTVTARRAGKVSSLTLTVNDLLQSGNTLLMWEESSNYWHFQCSNTGVFKLFAKSSGADEPYVFMDAYF